MATPKANSFGTFLQSLGSDESSQKAAPRPVRSEDRSMALLQILQSSGSLTMPALFAQSGMTVDDFAQTLARLRELGFVEVTGQDGQQQAKLSASGEEVVRLAAAQ